MRPHKTWVCRHICQFQHMWPPAGAPGKFCFSLMHPIGPELPISAHVACARVCLQPYVLRASHALVQATVGDGTVIIVYIGVAYTRRGGGWQQLGTTGRGGPPPWTPAPERLDKFSSGPSADQNFLWRLWCQLVEANSFLHSQYSAPLWGGGGGGWTRPL